LYSSPNTIRIIKSRKMRWEGNVERLGAMRNECKILVGYREGKIPFASNRCKWDDNIKIDVSEIG
jgi:hypothetical protein